MRDGLSRREVLQLGLGLGAAGLGACSGEEAAFGFGGRDQQQPRSAAEDYKALVCVFLVGGNDAYNTVVPITPEKHEPYARARLNLAVPSSALLPLDGAAPDGATYGMQSSCSELRDLFNGGRMAIVGNVGSLAFPVTRQDFASGRALPARLFSHNDQQDQWQTSRAEGNGVLHGWAGRVADALADVNGSAELPMNISIAGANLLQTGRFAAPFTISPQGPARLGYLPEGSPLRKVYDRVLEQPRANLLEQTYAGGHARAIRLNRVLESALAAAPPMATQFPADNRLADQLAMVARLIGVRAQLGMRRQIYFVSMGGFDTHDAQTTQHPALLLKLSQALDAFYRATSELGVADAVTTFTASDFGRSLTVNGKGTDHGWSGHHFVFGGAVRGGAWYGSMPSLVPDGDDDTRGGRFIPSVAVDEYAATLTRWLGVSDGDLDYVVPNLRRFATRGLGFL